MTIRDTIVRTCILLLLLWLIMKVVIIVVIGAIVVVTVAHSVDIAVIAICIDSRASRSHILLLLLL